MLLVTVMHTGSMSLKKQHPDCEHRHCDYTSLKRIRDGEKALTTYREPEQVADSWKRRGWFEHKKYKDIWWKQWSYYDAITREDVNVIPTETLEYHLNHIDGEEHPGKYLNEDMINHARQCSRRAKLISMNTNKSIN